MQNIYITGYSFLACVRLDMLQYTGYFQGKIFSVRQNTQGGRNAIIIEEETLPTNREECQSIPRSEKQNLRLGKGFSDQRIQSKWDFFSDIFYRRSDKFSLLNNHNHTLYHHLT